jgi:nucleotide-binding universal stress UspA family protein/mono/diheme cytochrome c family protein
MTLDIKRILVPTDFSAHAEPALDYAAAMARKFEAAIHLLHVCEVPAMVTGSMDAYAIAYTDWSQQLGDEAESALTRLRGRFSGVPVTSEVLFGNPARCIVSAAKSNQADMIVMGTHGHGPMMHLMMGNVAERVVRMSPVPVLTVRQPHELVDEKEHETSAPRRLSTLAAVGALLLGLLLPATAIAQENQKQTIPGRELFRTYCATCHGTAAKGDGPLASSMRRRPADLTEIAKRNGGEFPSDLVFRTIDGRQPVRGHGGPDMPVWGDAFERARDGGDTERVKKMIQSLVDYLESIQARTTNEP